MKRRGLVRRIEEIGIALGLLCASSMGCLGAEATNKTVLGESNLAPIMIRLPAPSMLTGGPRRVDQGPHVEPLSTGRREPFLARAGATNLALRKKVTASNHDLFSGSLAQVTDGDKEATEESIVSLRKGKQWVQIDLGEPSQLSAIVIWRDQSHRRIFRGVLVQISNDAEFTSSVRTLFNNDHQNLIGLGAGTDKEYHETFEGKLIEGKENTARYVRSYSSGSNVDVFNKYTEIEVWGLRGE